MVMQIAGGHEFVSPVIEAGDAGTTSERGFERRPLLGAQGIAQARHGLHPARPSLGTLLKPALPIGPPVDLLHELLHGLERPTLAGRGDDFLFQEQTLLHPWGKPRSIRMSWADEITVRRIAPGIGQEFLQTRQGRGTGRQEVRRRRHAST